MLSLVLWSATWVAGESLRFEQRVDAVRTVERARYAFTLDAAVPFDEAHGHYIVERRVRREMREEALLAARFGTRVSRAMLAAEFVRIERQTEDPEQWQAIQRALGRDRRLLEEAICRPLVVGRLLRQHFAFDEEIHAQAHAKARQARTRFIQGRPMEGAQVLKLARANGPPPDPRTGLAEAKAQAKGPRVLSSPGEPRESPTDRPVSLHPEAARVLESQLLKPGDVSTILSEQDRFAVYRLIEKTEKAWTVQAAIFAKHDFEAWFREQAISVPAASRNR